MINSIKKLNAIVIFVIVITIVCVVNLLVLFTQPAKAAKPKPAHTLKYVANNVWHCDTGGTIGCDTVSSHVWY